MNWKSVSRLLLAILFALFMAVYTVYRCQRDGTRVIEDEEMLYRPPAPPPLDGD